MTSLSPKRVPAVTTVFAALMFCQAHFVSAQANQPMKFTWTRSLGGQMYIWAAGEIMPDTPDRFKSFQVSLRAGGTLGSDELPKVFFDSPGGNLKGGVELGEAIRQSKMATDVGSQGIFVNGNPAPFPGPGMCASACTFAYLGGVARSFSVQGSRFGVHRFSGLSGDNIEQLAQLTGGALVEYTNKMGVSSEFYTVMTQGSPEKLVWLDATTMAALHVTTNDVITGNISNHDGNPELLVTDENGGQDLGRIAFFCSDKHLVARGLFKSPPPSVNRSSLALDWYIPRGLDFSTSEHISVKNFRFSGADKNQLLADADVATPVLNSLMSAPWFWLSLEETPYRLQNWRSQNWMGWDRGPQVPQSVKVMLKGVASGC